jgi:hypothetical protein
MSKFFRKVASAFVVVDDQSQADAQASSDAAEGLENITSETSTLLAQLEGSPAGSGAAADPNAAPSADRMDMTAEDVFRQSDIDDSPNSALRLLKLVAGLSMFSRDQQLAMVRAMDVADDHWAEADVVQDARKRQAVLRRHLSRIAQERTVRTNDLSSEIKRAKTDGDAVLAEIDQRIAALQTRRQQEAATTAASVVALEQQQKELELQETKARQGIAQVIQALGGLLTFLGVPQGPEGS